MSYKALCVGGDGVYLGVGVMEGEFKYTKHQRTSHSYS